MEETVRFELNGKKTEMLSDPDHNLLWVLRNRFGLTGTKYGCGIGYCGACTVLMDQEAVISCTLKVRDADNKKIVTIEGLANNGTLHPVQKAFIENDALQCGYCTPGMIMNAVGLLLKNPEPSQQEIIMGMEDNLCRCGAHVRIIKAIQTAAREMKGGKQT
ncbi:MAG: ferredoxin [Bacteroidetes bacterium GWE2_41_25]|nr:MAG: ferredoxin [Bacteroidetes bacterium GWA2_40_15]OFX91262.1 MAG: ferredoxin [Bacteroidetes bacterium GWC2_40_22]OFX92947.1 MAG: ferredoxin [Bacteroidetes bacterium GWE2_41_25]OFY57641.1 MAG: ferredoxin [Bacteroidetes bacterium GWF2_41_9]HAM08913.1 ferredoxin [Bacteroidales bacterium]